MIGFALGGVGLLVFGLLATMMLKGDTHQPDPPGTSTVDRLRAKMAGIAQPFRMAAYAATVYYVWAWFNEATKKR